MASRSTFALTATLLLALPGRMIIDALTEVLRSENLNTTTQKEIQHEIQRNATLVDQTKTGFVPSFHLGSIDASIEPSKNLRKQVQKSPFNDDQGKSFMGDGSNSLFNKVRPIKFNHVNNDLKKSEKQFPFRLLEKNENFVKFEYDKKEHEEHRNLKEENMIKLKQRYSQVPPRFDQSEYSEGQQQVQEVTYMDGNSGTGQQYVTYEVKPSKFHDPPAYSLPYEHVAITGDNHYVQYKPGHFETFQLDEKFVEPETIINVHPMSYQATSFDMHTKPKTVVYVTSHETAVKEKFPYQYYQPLIFDHTANPTAVTGVDSELLEHPFFFEQQSKSILPWKKIFHIIGAFLPLGLLFALLSPKVINADQNTDSNIVLSKLRINDLPVEHKQSRLLLDNDNEDECVERLICRLMLAAHPTNSNFVRHLLLQITSRTLESGVRKKELERIFEAAKLGNCDILTCNFYGGT